MIKFFKASLFVFVFFSITSVFAWEGMPMPKLRVEGRYLKDSHGHIVNLHGFAQTYSPWFNEENKRWGNYDVNACLKYNKGLIDKMLTAGWKMNFIRLHMDPYWSNTPGCTPKYHEAHNCFNETRFKKYLDEVFVPMAEYAISKGLYVVMRPPGVSPEEIKVGDDYQEYLIKVWGIVAKHPKLMNNSSVMFELANEPVDILGTDGTYGAGNQGHFDNLKIYFQAMVNTIRATADNILWIPGLGYQSLYAGYAKNPIEGENIGYAVHVYPGWFNSGNGYEPFQRGWNNQVQPVADFAPIIVTEMDWAPARHGKSWGKDSTGVAGGKGFGANFKKIADGCGNVSWLLFTSPHLLAEFGNPNAAKDVVDFLTDPEACPYPIYHWYKEYANEYDFKGASDSYITMTDLKLEGGNDIFVQNKSSLGLKINAVFADGHVENVASAAQVSVDNPDVVKVMRGRIFTLKDGSATIKASYTDKKGTKKEVEIKVTSFTFPLTEKLFNADIYGDGTYDEKTKTLKTGQWGFGGWEYDGIDLSDTKYIVVRLGSPNNANIDFRVFDGSSYWGSPATFAFGSKQEVVVPLKYSKRNDGKPLNPKNIYIAGFWSNGSNPFVIDTVFLSNSSEYDFPIVFAKDNGGNEISRVDGFIYRENSGPSASKPIFINGDMLLNGLLVQASADYEVSLSETDGFASSILLNPTNGVVDNVKVFVRLKQGLTRKSYSGSITISSNEAQNKKVTLSGKVDYPVGIENAAVNKNKVVSTEYYLLSGQKIKSVDLRRGIVIEKNLMSDGKIVTNKKIIK